MAQQYIDTGSSNIVGIITSAFTRNVIVFCGEEFSLTKFLGSVFNSIVRCPNNLSLGWYVRVTLLGLESKGTTGWDWPVDKIFLTSDCNLGIYF